MAWGTGKGGSSGGGSGSNDGGQGKHGGKKDPSDSKTTADHQSGKVDNKHKKDEK
ncbi:hypothetical protein ACFP3U_31085 [Kitasatospora misakiensis]|uniref:Uncharacterized protein n=1 Tax=Kitasatospora misakiensis TaxID=67330 RepID=A0ABW0XC47_9ACTN